MGGGYGMQNPGAYGGGGYGGGGGQPPWGGPPGGPGRPQRHFGAGARVLVQWSDGNKYPATVQQSQGPQALVVFPDGRQQWVDIQFLVDEFGI